MMLLARRSPTMPAALLRAKAFSEHFLGVSGSDLSLQLCGLLPSQCQYADRPRCAQGHSHSQTKPNRLRQTLTKKQMGQ